MYKIIILIIIEQKNIYLTYNIRKILNERAKVCTGSQMHSLSLAHSDGNMSHTPFSNQDFHNFIFLVKAVILSMISEYVRQIGKLRAPFSV